MRRMFTALLLTVLGLAAPRADEVPQSLRRPAPESEAQAEAKGFSALMLITLDADWQEKWAAGNATTPHFQQASEAKIGQQVFILLFFSNPRLSGARLADLTCDIDIARPDGTLALHRPDEVCYRGMLRGDAHNVYLAYPVIGFTGDPGDPLGEWTVRATLRDNLRHVSLSLRAPLTLR
jgi:hypothetical protein